MLSPEIKAQVMAVLQARQVEDQAFRLVMAIDKKTPKPEVERRARNHELCARMTARREYTLANMCIKQHNQESEAEADDSITETADQSL